MTSTTFDGVGPAARPRLRTLSIPRPRPELVGLLALAAVLDLWALSRNGWANEYYSAAVRSMSTSWHAFLYGSFDAAGVMTVDKPPLALWVQALSVRVFGFHPLSMLVPQALMGVATVGLVYDLVRRRFGRVGGFVAGAALAITPVTVAVSRHNNPDALLVLCCVGALWCLVRALEDGRTRWIVWSGVCVGLGFEAKMAAALLVVPAIAAAWMWVAPRGRMAAARALAAGGAAMVAVGGAWPALMALTPAANRPWISGTSDNSVWSLIFGYNGLGRLFGQAGGPGAQAGGGLLGGGAGAVAQAGGGLLGGGAGTGAGGVPGTGAGAQAAGGVFGGGPPGGGGSLFGGSPGVLRLLGESLGGQAGWLLGVAIVGGLGILIATRARRVDPRTGWLIAVGGTFLTIAVAFSAARGIFHPYYVSQLAPFAAALVGATAAHILTGGRATRIVGPLAIAGGVATELAVLHANPGQLTWLPPVLILAAGSAAAMLALGSRRLRTAAVIAALGVLALAPATWAAQTLGHATSGTFPAGGPASASFDGGPGGRGAAAGPPGPGGGTTSGGTSAGPGGSAGQRGTVPGGSAGGTTTPNGAGSASGGTTGGTTAGGTTGGSTAGGTTQGGVSGGLGGGGPFGGDAAAIEEVLAYTRAHGGGTVGVSSQTGAASAIIASGGDVAGLGGFSGRESEVDVNWLANAVESGRIRWVLVSSDGGGLGNDGRVGSSALMAAVANSGRKVGTFDSGVLYDLSGRAAALRAAA